jgi:hypothetical protein
MGVGPGKLFVHVARTRQFDLPFLVVVTAGEELGEEGPASAVTEKGD